MSTNETGSPCWKAGFEIELMAPRGSSRAALAREIAARAGGSVRRVFYPQSEIDTAGRVKGYETLTLGFEVLDARGLPVVRLVDDITLNADLDLDVEGASGWYRVLSTHKCVLDLVEARCDAEAPLEEVLAPLAELYRTAQRHGPQGMRVVDSKSGTLAAALPLAGERERACELITPPLLAERAERLRFLLGAASESGFTVPKESATHVHFDGEALSNPKAFRNVVAVFHRFREILKARFRTNPACTRLGPWPDDLLSLVASERFVTLPWPEARRAIDSTRILKWCDFNLLNLVDPFASKRTFEVRILPTVLDAPTVVGWASFFERLLRRAVDAPLLTVLPTLPAGAQAEKELEAFLATGAFPTPAPKPVGQGFTVSTGPNVQGLTFNLTPGPRPRP